MGAVPIVCAEEEVDAGNGAPRYPAAAVESYMIHIKLPKLSQATSASAIGIREEQDDKWHS